MGSVKVTVFGRIKPCPRNVMSKEYRLKTGEDEDFITFSTSKPAPSKKTYRFQKIFTQHATQEEVFDAVAKPVIESVLSGYNGTIFTYGQTGSGKTYTMTGDIEKWIYPGLIPRTIQRIFQLKDKDMSVSITYCEIYNEHVYDLIRSERLDPNSEINHVNVFEDATGITRFRNLSVHIVNTAYEAMQLLIRGDANKMMAETTSNAKSSRSHVLFSITLEVPHPEHEKLYLKPVLYLVDLAGSEKLNKSKNQNNPWETRYINLSLHYLEQVLLALRQPGRVHIPYRNSLMTALLRNSLGGNCFTSMIATFCLSVDDIEESIQTCRFAERIALIKNEVKVTDTFNTEREIDELRKENKRLKSQIKLLNGQLLNHELTEEEKEKCAELVQVYISNSSVDCLPFSDLRRMEYCLSLLRDQIVNKNKAESKKQDNIRDYMKKENNTELGPDLDQRNSFANKFSKMSGNNLHSSSTGSTNNINTSSIARRKKNVMQLPKVNILYNRWKMSNDHIAEVEDRMQNSKKVTKRKDDAEFGVKRSDIKPVITEPPGQTIDSDTSNNTINNSTNNNNSGGGGNNNNSSNGVNVVSGETDVPAVRGIRNGRGDVTDFSDGRNVVDLPDRDASVVNVTAIEPVSLSPSYDDSKNETFKVNLTNLINHESYLVATNGRRQPCGVNLGETSDHDLDPVYGPTLELAPRTESGVTFKIDNLEAEKPGQIAIKQLKKLISVGVQINTEYEIESEEELEVGRLVHGDRAPSMSSLSSQLSWSYLPLTGDSEVDEEILKFYRTRYKVFKEQEK